MSGAVAVDDGPKGLFGVLNSVGDAEFGYRRITALNYNFNTATQLFALSGRTVGLRFAS